MICFLRIRTKLLYYGVYPRYIFYALQEYSFFVDAPSVLMHSDIIESVSKILMPFEIATGLEKRPVLSFDDRSRHLNRVDARQSGEYNLIFDATQEAVKKMFDELECIQNVNEENDYGHAILPRPIPFGMMVNKVSDYVCAVWNYCYDQGGNMEGSLLPCNGSSEITWLRLQEFINGHPVIDVDWVDCSELETQTLDLSASKAAEGM